MRKIVLTLLGSAFCIGAVHAREASEFDMSKGIKESVQLPTGETVDYTACRDLYYVGNVVDSTYQTLNIFIPEGAGPSTPIFLRNNIGGYMASKAGNINPGDATGRALKEGYVVVVPGARGRNSVITNGKGDKIFTGRAPAALLDLKAAVRYLRHYDKEMPGNAEKIISDGTSAGGAMSALLGTTGNNPDYKPYLQEMGAFDERDDIFATVCYCPITDLEHADQEYEWLFSCTDNIARSLTPEQFVVSEQLAALCPDYINSLGLKKPDGTALDSNNYLSFIQELIIKSAQEAKDAGAVIPDSIGFTFSTPAMELARGAQLMRNKEDKLPKLPRRNGSQNGFRPTPMKEQGEYITGLDMSRYLNYMATVSGLKKPPAFDRLGVAGGEATAENEEFGDSCGNSVNFTDYSLQQHTGDPEATVSKEIQHKVYMLNPMNYIGDESTTTSQYWYIRHGAKDTDTSFLVPINLAIKLQNTGKTVDFKIPWNRPHSGDYALSELFAWIASITKE